MASDVNWFVGKACLVTGANTGIGRATAVEMARRGARVIVACRSEAKGIEAVLHVKRESGKDAVTFLPLDLASLDSVRTAAHRVLDEHEELPLLVNNAGVAGQRGITADGFELHFGTNHMGHFLLTTLLLDRLKASPHARIVNVSSKSHYDAKGLDFDVLERSTPSFTGLPEYAVSKLCNVLFTAELAKRLAGTNVRAYALHPGVVASDAWRRIPWPIRPFVTRNMITNEEGAKTTLHCATSPALADVSGRYYDDENEKAPSALAGDAELAAKLWEEERSLSRESLKPRPPDLPLSLSIARPDRRLDRDTITSAFRPPSGRSPARGDRGWLPTPAREAALRRRADRCAPHRGDEARRRAHARIRADRRAASR